MPDGRRRGNRTIGSVTVLTAAVGIWLITTDDVPQPPPQPSQTQGFLGTERRLLGELSDERRQDRGRTAGSQPVAMAPAEPERVRIPSLRIDAPLTALGLEADGSLQAPPPDDKNLAGWYADGTPPAPTARPSSPATSTTNRAPPSSTNSEPSRRASASKCSAGTEPQRPSPSTRSRSTTAETSPTNRSTARQAVPNCASSPAAARTRRRPDTRPTSSCTPTSHPCEPPRPEPLEVPWCALGPRVPPIS